MRIILRVLMLALLLALLPTHWCFARGFGGGGFRGGGGFGGGGRSFGGGEGGGFRGGAGGFSGGGEFGGGGSRNFGGGGFSAGGAGGGFAGGDRGAFGGQNFGGGPSRFGQGGAGEFRGGTGGFSRDGFGDNFSGGAPNRGQLNSFLGLPSDEGLHNFSGASGNFGNNFDVNHGSYEGPRGGEAAGTTVTGPRGNTYGRGAAVGPNGGVVAGRGVEGAGGGAAGQGIAVGPDGRAVAGGAVRGPDGGAAARGVAVGPRGYAAGFAAVSPSGRYSTAVGVRGNFNHYNYFRPDWYARNPGAWYAAGWAASSAWTACNWNTLGDWFAYNSAPPVYYDYGNNVTYQDNSVYVNGQDVGTSQQYYDQAAALATDGASAPADVDANWLPLGVFALCKAGQTSSDLLLQLAVNKAGVIRGNYTDGVGGKSNLVHGSVDKQTQRVAFTVGDNTTTVVETGLYNLTKDEAPCLIHFEKDRTEQWLLVRLQQDQQGGASGGDAAPADASAADGAGE